MCCITSISAHPFDSDPQFSNTLSPGCAKLFPGQLARLISKVILNRVSYLLLFNFFAFTIKNFMPIKKVKSSQSLIRSWWFSFRYWKLLSTIPEVNFHLKLFSVHFAHFLLFHSSSHIHISYLLTTRVNFIKSKPPAMKTPGSHMSFSYFTLLVFNN